MKFKVLAQSKKSRARVGLIETDHGQILTPGFVPVGTQASVKGVDTKTLGELGTQLVFCNTYHLMLRPGIDVVEKAGGLHKFAGFSIPLFTDSGGFQVFSLRYGGVTEELKSSGQKRLGNSVLKVTEEGVSFRAYTDGRRIELSAESSIAAQKALGADLIVVFDELLPYHTDPKVLKKSFDRTHRWATRSLDAHKKDHRNQGLYAVIHGGMDFELRKKSAQILSAQDFEGLAIGGSLGKNSADLKALLENLMPHLGQERPIHLLGIGDLPSIDIGVPLGIDTFDSSLPTKAARHGTILTKHGNVKLRSTAMLSQTGPLENGCKCPTCQNYSAGYVAHLFRANELLGLTLASIHNIFFMNQRFQEIREMIQNNQI